MITKPFIYLVKSRNNITSHPSYPKIIFWVAGFFAFLWVLLRSGTNPKRLAYPCQKAMYPLASAWLIAIVGMLAGGLFLKKAFRFSLPLVAIVISSWLLISSSTNTIPASVGVYPVWESQSPVSTVFVFDNVPSTTGSLAAGDASVPDNYLSDPAIDSLVQIMENGGTPFFKTTQLPSGIVGKNDVVIIKANFQWRNRMGTNTDRIKGVIWQILSHPDGFSGEILVCDNEQSQIWPTEWLAGFNDHSNNSDDLNQSIVDVVNTFKAKGYPVDYYAWDQLNNNVVDEYQEGDMASGYIYNTTTKVTYPKFQTPHGNYVSLKNGVWNTETNSYNNELLTIINFPVLKAHGMAGATIAIKNWIGVMNVTHAEWFGGYNVDDYFHPSYCFSPTALPARVMDEVWPKLNIVDATWTATTSNYNYNLPSVKTKTILASTDPVAVSWYAAKYILTPVANSPYYTNPGINDNGTYGRMLNYWYNYLANNTSRSVTKDSAEISVYGREMLTTEPEILVESVTISSQTGNFEISNAGGTLQLYANVEPDNATDTSIAWSVQNLTAMATISQSGLVTAISNGTVRVFAIANDASAKKDSVDILISGQNILLESINLTSQGGKTGIQTFGGTLQVYTNVSPKNATDTTVNWSIINIGGQATVSANGLVTAIENGPVKVVALANDAGHVSDTFDILISGQEILLESINIISTEGASAIAVHEGTLRLFTNVQPKNAEDTTVTWSVINETGLASVSEDGLVTASENGIVRIVATANDAGHISDTFDIIISNQGVLVESINIFSENNATSINTHAGTLQLFTNILPEVAADTGIVWSVLNLTGQASVSANGLVTAIKNGTVEIIAAAIDGSNVTDTFEITISNQGFLLESITISSNGGISLIDVYGATLQLYTNVMPKNAVDTTVTWSVLNVSGQAIVTNNGLVTASANGLVKIIATANDAAHISDTFDIVISNQEILLESINLFSRANSSSITTHAGSLQLFTNVLPKNANDTSVTWSIENLTGTAVISDGGLVTAIQNGIVRIHVRANDAAHVSETFDITISNQFVNVDSIVVFSFNNQYSFDISEQSVQFYSRVFPANATDTTVSWSVTENTGSATIDNSGLLQLTGPGEISVTATANGGNNVSQSKTVVITDGSNNNQTPVNELFTVYPNPTANTIYIEYSIEQGQNLHIEIFNLSNQKVSDSFSENSGEPLPISLEALPAGVYFIKIITSQNYYIHRIIRK